MNGITTVEKPVIIKKTEVTASLNGKVGMHVTDAKKVQLWRSRRQLIALLKTINEELLVDACAKCGQ